MTEVQKIESNVHTCEDCKSLKVFTVDYGQPLKKSINILGLKITYIDESRGHYASLRRWGMHKMFVCHLFPTPITKSVKPLEEGECKYPLGCGHKETA